MGGCVWGSPVPAAGGGLQPTSLPGDGFQVAGAGGQLASVEPQAAAAVGGLLAGTGLDAVAGVLRREGERWPWCRCPALPGPWPRTTSQSQLCHHCAHAAESPGLEEPVPYAGWKRYFLHRLGQPLVKSEGFLLGYACPTAG